MERNTNPHRSEIFPSWLRQRCHNSLQGGKSEKQPSAPGLTGPTGPEPPRPHGNARSSELTPSPKRRKVSSLTARRPNWSVQGPTWRT